MLLTPTFLQNFCQALIDGAAKSGVRFRAFGGTGIRMRCPFMNDNGFSYKAIRNDIDLVADSAQMIQVDEFLQDSKCVRQEKNFYSGGEHWIYEFRPESDQNITINIDVYFGQLRFNHILPPPYFDENSKYTLPITQLLLSKLAIVEISAHDTLGVCSLLAEHEIGDTPNSEIIQEALLKRVWCRGKSGWCIAKTCLENIRNIRQIVSEMSDLSEAVQTLVCARLNKLEQIIMRCPKSIGWRIRDAIGTSVLGIRIKWYYDVRPPEASTTDDDSPGPSEMALINDRLAKNQARF